MKNQKNMLVTASLALCLIGLSVGQANAFGGIGGDWRTQYPDACPTLITASNSCTFCHAESGFDMNPYGQDLKDSEAGNIFLDIEGLDSDGDGRTNGQEINLDCTLPGDAGSVPADTVQWGQIKALFR